MLQHSPRGEFYSKEYADTLVRTLQAIRVEQLTAAAACLPTCSMAG